MIGATVIGPVSLDAEWVDTDLRLVQVISIPQLPEVQVPDQGDPVQEGTSDIENPPGSFADPNDDPNYDPGYEDSRGDGGNHGHRKKPNKHGERRGNGHEQEDGDDEHEEED